MPTVTATTPAPNFDRLALLYRWLEYLTLGPFLQRCRTYFLPWLMESRRALVLGDGDGRFTAALLRANASVHITAIDASPRMIAALEQAAAPHDKRLITHIADLRLWNPGAFLQPPYDLVVTHFFFDCLSSGEIASLAERLAPHLAPNALWLVSEFAIPPTLFGRAVAAPLVALLYRAFGLLTGLRQRTLPNHPRLLASAGWSCAHRRRHLQGLLVSELWQRL